MSLKYNYFTVKGLTFFLRKSQDLDLIALHLCVFHKYTGYICIV